ncbi:hypothetical protein BC939DRAFT_473202 [Gamsiella multidivaricata]|uniref:uncharacterized protein n=1 Tax=Gamsiella multidivaricata TaxID=101098 RepID=UPI00221E623D|nr:uncharacterized protein BC939DRAFT_473202 [Gamsiella multidivaricata]KAI7831133.1 hypothetical protein BC939DRAFT_473202 [Gamsiella multidivaricata]
MKEYSYWDILPPETVLNVCTFLPTLDLLNLCATYPAIDPLVTNTASLWQSLHLPFPDPFLYSYPGWQRRCPIDDLTSVPGGGSGNSRHERRTSASRSTLFQDGRYRTLSEPAYYDLPDIEGGEFDSNENNTVWIILDVLGQIPLQFVQHLSFDCPPCQLCVYPCRQFCVCECHQNGQKHDPRSGTTLDEAGDNTQQRGFALLSQPLQDLFELGLVNFSRHIDLRSLNGSFDLPGSNIISSAASLHSNFSSLNDFGRQGALQQLDHFEGEQLLDPQSSLSKRGKDNARASEEAELLPQENILEQERRQSETRAAYQRARILIRILSLNGLDTLQTLRAPWRPAAKIYVIRQQLERWSFMFE